MDVVAQAGDGLAAAYAVGLVHRDVKPGNLCWVPAGQVKITDFGIRHAARSAPIIRHRHADRHPGRPGARAGVGAAADPPATCTRSASWPTSAGRSASVLRNRDGGRALAPDAGAAAASAHGARGSGRAGGRAHCRRPGPRGRECQGDRAAGAAADGTPWPRPIRRTCPPVRRPPPRPPASALRGLTAAEADAWAAGPSAEAVVLLIFRPRSEVRMGAPPSRELMRGA